MPKPYREHDRKGQPDAQHHLVHAADEEMPKAKAVVYPGGIRSSAVRRWLPRCQLGLPWGVGTKMRLFLREKCGMKRLKTGTVPAKMEPEIQEVCVIKHI